MIGMLQGSFIPPNMYSNVVFSVSNQFRGLFFFILEVRSLAEAVTETLLFLFGVWGWSSDMALWSMLCVACRRPRQFC